MSEFTIEQAKAAGHRLVTYNEPDGVLFSECEDDDGARCFTFSPYHEPATGVRLFLEHAAEDAGVCPACCGPDDYSNRDDCRRCWLLYWSTQGVMPRDAPAWPQGSD